MLISCREGSVLSPTPQLDIMASLSWADADKKPIRFMPNGDYGWEIDVTGTYKITNNLSYMLGAGYLLTVVTLRPTCD